MKSLKIIKGAAGIIIFFAIFFGLVEILVQVETAYGENYPDEVEGINLVDNFFEGVWYATITISSVGYGDYVPHSPEGRVIGYCFVLASIMMYGFFIAQLSNFIARRNETRKLGHKGTKMKDHTVMLGWDDYAKLVADQLVSVGGRVAIITESKNDIDLIKEHFHNNLRSVFVLFSEYDNYDLLRKANIEDSKVVFINLPTDTQKLVSILNLKKEFKKKLNFIVNIDNADLKDTFVSAGVSQAISKEDLASKLIASYIFEPDVATLAEELMTVADNDDDHDIKEYIVVDDNDYLGHDYNEAFFDVKKKHNSILLGISKKNTDGTRTLIKNPEGGVRIELGDYLIIITNGKHTPAVDSAFGTEEGI